MMKIVLVGANGTIGKAVIRALADDHDIIRAGRQSGDITLDMTDPSSILEAFSQIGSFDALLCTAGEVVFNKLRHLSTTDWYSSIDSKLMGQINLTRGAIEHLVPNGSITLISGILSDRPVLQGTCATVINAAVEHYAKAAGPLLPHGIRINVVSPGLLEESAQTYADYFPGFNPVSSHRVAMQGLRMRIIIRIWRLNRAYDLVQIDCKMP